MKCVVCKKKIENERECICEICGGEHHIKCSGEESCGSGEYPDEEAYSICVNCLKKMLKEQEECLRLLVDANEEMKGGRIIIDYAIGLACSFYRGKQGSQSDLNKEMTQYVEKLYKELYFDLPDGGTNYCKKTK